MQHVNILTLNIKMDACIKSKDLIISIKITNLYTVIQIFLVAVGLHCQVLYSSASGLFNPNKKCDSDNNHNNNNSKVRKVTFDPEGF